MKTRTRGGATLAGRHMCTGAGPSLMDGLALRLALNPWPPPARVAAVTRGAAGQPPRRASDRRVTRLLIARINFHARCR